ncbi:MAG TPA: hypothetical protein VHR84_12225 [Terriglobales bacterium]|jgi:hypothetical protein|nr:hypothetical protein [Terriglobales bacterium]
MKNLLLMSLFMLATLAWAAAQQPGSAPDPNSGQSASPSSQMPGQSQPSSPGAADQSGAQGQAGSQGQASSSPITEGCLGGSEPNYTITDKAGTAYKLNMPANANTSSLKSHIGESVQVQGDLKDTGKPSASIDVQRIGRGSGTCSGSGSNSASPNSANPNSASPNSATPDSSNPNSSQPNTAPPPKQ